MKEIIELLRAIAIATLENKNNIEALMKQQGLTPCREMEPEIERQVPPEEIDLPCMTQDAKVKLINQFREQGKTDDEIRHMLMAFK